MDIEKLRGLVQQMLDATKQYVTCSAAPLEARIKALEATQIHYRGVWSEGDSYLPNDIATHSGCLWFCEAPTTDRPGTSNAWRLMQKNQ